MFPVLKMLRVHLVMYNVCLFFFSVYVKKKTMFVGEILYILYDIGETGWSGKEREVLG